MHPRTSHIPSHRFYSTKQHPPAALSVCFCRSLESRSLQSGHSAELGRTGRSKRKPENTKEKTRPETAQTGTWKSMHRSWWLRLLKTKDCWMVDFRGNNIQFCLQFKGCALFGDNLICSLALIPLIDWDVQLCIEGATWIIPTQNSKQYFSTFLI